VAIVVLILMGQQGMGPVEEAGDIMEEEGEEQVQIPVMVVVVDHPMPTPTHPLFYIVRQAVWVTVMVL
jgi:hypothetical protein